LEYEEDVLARARNAPPPQQAAAAPSAAPPLPPAVPRDSASRRAEFSHNGGCVGESYLWSQSASELTLSVLVPAGTSARDISVALLPPSLDASPRLRVSLRGAPLLDEQLAHGVQAEAAEEGAEAVPDWELVDLEPAGRRVVRVTLRKATPAAAMVLWWASALRGGPEVDTSGFEERQGSAKRTAAARAVWKEAEQMFLESVKQRQPIEIDTRED